MNTLGKIYQLFGRHIQALGYVLTVILPVIIRTGRRPVVFSKYSGMGDIICTFPAVLELKKLHPGATFIYNCHQQYACLPPMGNVTEHVTNLRQTGTLKHWYGWLLAAGYDFPCADELPDACCKDYVVKEYAHDHGVEVAAVHPRLTIPANAQARIKDTIQRLRDNDGPIIVLQTGPTWPIREWPRESWARLVEELKKSGFSNIFQIGTEHHLSVGAAQNTTIAGVKSLVNQLTLEESAAVIEASDLFVGIDSGLLHIAAALRIPCVGIFGPTSPHLRLPASDDAHCVVSKIDCQGCHHRIPRIHWETGCPFDANCMKQITFMEVHAACLKALEKQSLVQPMKPL